MKKACIKPRRELPQIVSVDTLHAILDQSPETIYEIRDAAICELFYSSGLRLSELANLNISDLNLKTKEVWIKNGKGGKGRIVPLSSHAKKAILAWFKVRSNMKNCSIDAVFIGRNGTRLGDRQIRYRVKAYGNKISKYINLNPHKLRHSMATHILESSGDLRAVQELLGHANISTTEIYTHVDCGTLFKSFDKYHPRAKRKKK